VDVVSPTVRVNLFSLKALVLRLFSLICVVQLAFFFCYPAFPFVIETNHLDNQAGFVDRDFVERSVFDRGLF